MKSPDSEAAQKQNTDYSELDGIDAMSQPARIQLQRKKGWKLPPNTISVARPHKWGNPFSVEEYGRDLAIANFRRRLDGLRAIGALYLSELRGKNLACWCKRRRNLPCRCTVGKG